MRYYLGAAAYFLVINMMTYLVFASDKRRAERGSWRVPESRLFILVLLGGGIGALYAMKRFHHKTRKPAFKYGIPIIMIFQVIILIFACIIMFIYNI